jgi:hypothetical protein
MLDKIVLSQDRREALIVTDDKTWTLWHSEGKVMELVNEMIIEPMERRARMEEDTQVIEIIDVQLSLFTDEEAA